jgi:hypothetical protein
MKKLKDILKEDINARQLKTEDKSTFLGEVKTFNTFAEAVYRNSQLKEVSSKINSICEKAEMLTLSETDDWFDQVTVKRNMKHLKENAKNFSKTVNEINTLQQRLESLYEEMGHTLGRYYEI